MSEHWPWLPPQVPTKTADATTEFGFKRRAKCLKCSEPVESWWSYCAMCGFWLAAFQSTST